MFLNHSSSGAPKLLNTMNCSEKILINYEPFKFLNSILFIDQIKSQQ